MDKRFMALGTSMLVLKLLENQSMYGYQIIKELDQQSQQVFSLQEGTLYPVLHSPVGYLPGCRQPCDGRCSVCPLIQKKIPK